MGYEAVFFDLDGTLLDTSKGVFRALDHISARYRLPALSEEEKRSFIGPPIQESYKKHFSLSSERAMELANEWRNAYKQLYLLDAVPYDGIYDLLRWCRARGIKTGVATNKREDYTRMLLEHFSFTELFDHIAGSDFAGRLTKADLIRACMARTGVAEPAGCVMVGDTDSDRNAAAQAGVGFIGVTYGFGFKRSMAPASFPLADNCIQVEEHLTTGPRA